MLVFKGQGDIRDFPGNYSDYRDWREAKEQREKEAEKPKEEKTARVRLNDKRKMSFKEKKEFEQLEQEISRAGAGEGRYRSRPLQRYAGSGGTDGEIQTIAGTE